MYHILHLFERYSVFLHIFYEIFLFYFYFIFIFFFSLLFCLQRYDSVETLRLKCGLLAEWIQGARHVVVHTGAGISTAAGIPDFRWLSHCRFSRLRISRLWDHEFPQPSSILLSVFLSVSAEDCGLTYPEGKDAGGIFEDRVRDDKNILNCNSARYALLWKRIFLPPAF